MAESYDVIIIGSGPGGYVGAIRAAQLGLKAAVVEKSYVGGVCPNWGCIPTKALLRSADIYHSMLQHAKDYGLAAKDVSVDIAAVVKRSRGIAEPDGQGVAYLLKKNKVDLIWGSAKLAGKGKVNVETADNAAEGRARARATIPPRTSSSRPARARVRYRALSPTRSSSGPISRRWCRRKPCRSRCSSSARARSASSSPPSSARSASEVTVVEILPQILPVEDAEIAAHARKRFEKAGDQDPHRGEGDEARQGQERRHRDDRAEGRQDRDAEVRSRHLRRRRRRQHRGAGARRRSA